jgi:hypothetical protein
VIGAIKKDSGVGAGMEIGDGESERSLVSDGSLDPTPTSPN